MTLALLTTRSHLHIQGITFDNIIYTYGSGPNIKLSVFGIITSCPPKTDNRVNLNNEYLGYEDEELKEEIHFEKAFR